MMPGIGVQHRSESAFTFDRNGRSRCSGLRTGVQALVTPTLPRVPAIHIPTPDLAQYDALLAGGGQC